MEKGKTTIANNVPEFLTMTWNLVWKLKSWLGPSYCHFHEMKWTAVVNRKSYRFYQTLSTTDQIAPDQFATFKHFRSFRVSVWLLLLTSSNDCIVHFDFHSQPILKKARHKKCINIVEIHMLEYNRASFKKYLID